MDQDDINARIDALTVALRGLIDAVAAERPAARDLVVAALTDARAPLETGDPADDVRAEALAELETLIEADGGVSR